jgi:hypothetical protein
MSRIALPALVAGVVATLAIAAPAGAAPLEGPASGVCPFKQAGIVGGKLTVGVNIGEASSTATARSGCRRVRQVVDGLVKAGAESPMRVAGYRCTPTVTGAKVAWRCVYRGGTPRTIVELLFVYRYAS